METLKFIKPESNFYKFIRLFNEADAACNDAWAVITTLRGLVAITPKMPSCGTNEPGLSYLLDRCAILDMEKAVEKLTCILLAPNNVETLGSISTRISLLKSTIERVECYMKEVRSWRRIGYILINGITQGNEQFVKGVLEALEARSVGGKSYEDAIDPKSYLIATEPYTRRTSRHKGIGATIERLDQEATPVSFSYSAFKVEILTRHSLTDCASYRQENPPLAPPRHKHNSPQYLRWQQQQNSTEHFL